MMPSASDSSVLRARRLPLVLALTLAGLLLPASPLLADGWPMGGAIPQRTAWCGEEVPGGLWPVWYRPIEPYIPQNIQVIVTEGRLYLSTARGLYCIKADNGELAWVYPTELPLGHCPTVVDGVVYVGGFDRKIHAIGAATGKGLWTFDGAGAAFHTNPLVIGGKVYAGNRDGNLYCIGAHKAPNAGKLIWKFPTGGPVNQSAAYDDGKVYFTSMDLHGYCLDAETGKQVWQTEKFGYNSGFHSWWPVVWAAKKMVVFVGTTPNYRAGSSPGRRALGKDYHAAEHEALYGSSQRGAIGETGTAAGDWAEGTPTVDMSKGVEYYQQYPYRRGVFVVDMASGKEYTFDHNGKPAYAPFMWTGSKQSSQRTAPAIGPDNVLYLNTHFRVAGTFGRGQVCGWTLGSKYLSTPSGRKDNAWDEPLGFCLGGQYVYWSLCCDRESGSYKITGGGGAQWTSYNLSRLAPGYDVMWKAVGDQDGTGNRLWGAYGSHNGIYHNHTVDQNPPIPYKGLVYWHRSNCLLAFGKGGKAKLDLAKIQPVKDAAFVPHDENWLKTRLAEEVRKILQAGHLRTGYFDGGQYWNRPVWGDNLNDYYAQPGDTLWALARALPYLSPDLQGQARQYMKKEFEKYPPHQVAHVGWQGAGREWCNIPPEVAKEMERMGPSPRAMCVFYQFPPQAAYAMWKYAQVFGGAEELLEQARRVIRDPVPDDKALNEFCYIANAFIAGYVGYLNLEKMAGKPESADIRQQLDRLMKLRADNFTKVTPWTDTSRGSHIKRMSVFRNYLYLTAELADYLRTNALDKVQDSLDHINFVAPYWFVTRYEGCLQESNIQNLSDYNCVFQAHAWILKKPRAELDKYLDVPAWRVGDMDYIQQLASLLEAK